MGFGGNICFATAGRLQWGCQSDFTSGMLRQSHLAIADTQQRWAASCQKAGTALLWCAVRPAGPASCAACERGRALQKRSMCSLDAGEPGSRGGCGVPGSAETRKSQGCSRARGRKNESGCRSPSSVWGSWAVLSTCEGCKLLYPPARFVVKAKCFFLSCNSQRL